MCWKSTHILDPDSQVTNVLLISVVTLQLAGAALQQRQELGLLPSAFAGVLCLLDEPASMQVVSFCLRIR